MVLGAYLEISMFYSKTISIVEDPRELCYVGIWLFRILSRTTTLWIKDIKVILLLMLDQVASE